MRRRFVAILVVLLLFQTIIVNAAPKKAVDYYQAALKLISQAKYDDAIKDIDLAIKMDTKSCLYYITKGSILNTKKLGMDAIQCYDKALNIIYKYPTVENKKHLYELFLNRGEAYYTMNKLYESTVCYDRAITYNSKGAKAYYNKAQILMQLKKFKEAIDCFNKVLIVEPNNKDSYYMKGLALQNLKNYGEAINAYKKAIELKVENGDIYYNMAICAASIDNIDLLISSLKKSITFDKKYIEYARYNSEFIKYRGNKLFIDVVGIVNERGNSIGNISNYGRYAVQGDWIYYCYNTGLFREKIDGSSKQKLLNENADEINVVGDWIYCNLFGVDSDGYHDNFGFFRIKTDGSEKEKLYGNPIGSVNIIGDKIYFYSEKDACMLSCMNLDGSGRKHINSLVVRCITVYGDWIYFQNGSADSKLYKMKIDGSELQKLSDISSYRLDINISGDWIYFTGDYPNTGLYKIKTDGTDFQKISDEQISYLNVVDDWIYYDLFWEDIYKMKIDGTDKQKLSSDHTTGINIVDDWIYYGKWKDDIDDYIVEGFYKMKTDGSNHEAIVIY